MIFKRLYFRVVIQVILLLAGCLTLSLVWDQSGLLYIRVTLVALIILQTFLMIRYLNKSNKRLLQFFTAVNAGDFSTSFSVKNIEPEFEELNHQLSKLSKYFNELKFDYEQQNAFYRAAIEHVGVGIFGFDDTDNVAFSNNSLHRTFGISHLRNLKNLDNIQNGTAEFFRKLVPHKTTLLEFNQEGNIYQLAVRSNKFKSPGKNLVLVSVQNIKPELEDREVEAWQKMIRVLTHEIMNSVSPISSLAESLNRLSEKEKLNTTWFESEKSRDKLGKGLETIQRRSTGLISFVEKFRSLTLLPQPQISTIKVTDLVESVLVLFESKLSSEKISFSKKVTPQSLTIEADSHQIEQVLINLLKNAVWAVSNNKEKQIRIFASEPDKTQIQIRIADNGPGIDQETQKKIFTPFFTTRIDGSGIGLSLSRQIMKMHDGSISVRSEPGKGAEFVLLFPALEAV